MRDSLQRVSKMGFLISFLLCCMACEQEVPVRFNGVTMGTTYMVKVSGESLKRADLAHLKSDVDQALLEVNRQMSTFIPHSEIARFNSLENRSHYVISSGFMDVLKLALQVHGESNGGFDITIGPLIDLWGFGKKGRKIKPPSDREIEQALQKTGSIGILIVNDSTISKINPQLEIDFSAIAKGHGVDVVASLLKNRGYENYLVEIGGEVLVRGLKQGNKWQIGIDKPQLNARPGEQLQAVLQITNLAMATSGDYRNYFISDDKTYSHTLNPSSGRPIINGVASVTVLAPSCVLADAMATAIMVMGREQGLAWVESKSNVECMIIQRLNKTYLINHSSGFEKYLKKQ